MSGFFKKFSMENLSNQEKVTAVFHALSALGQGTCWTPDPDLRSRVVDSVFAAPEVILEQDLALWRMLVKTCCTLLKNEDWQLAEQAAEKLGLMKATDALDDLIAAARDHGDSKVRLTAIEALGKIGSFSKLAHETLTALSHSEFPSIAGTAKDALGEIARAEAAEMDNRVRRWNSAWKPDANEFYELYRQMKFDSEQERIGFLEVTLRHLAGIDSHKDEQGSPWPPTHVNASEDSPASSEGASEPADAMIACEWCGTSVRASRLDKHKSERCPKAPADVMTTRPPRAPKSKGRIYGGHTSGSSLPGRCRFCGRHAMYGADVCYTCNTK